MKSRAGMVLVVIVAGLAARAGHYLAVKDRPYYEFASVWQDSDMYQFAAWGRHLAEGDWLDRDTFRPEFGWQRGVAPPEVWRSWFGAHVYYQPPLYPYLIAATLAATDSLDAFRLGQLLLGAVSCGLIALLAARLFGPAAGWMAGLAAAVHAPFIVYDLEILRGTVVNAAQLGLLLALTSTLEERHARRWRLGTLIAGAAFGLAYLADPAILLFGPLALLWIWWSAGWNHPGWSRTAAVPAMMALGVLIALAPLMARNRAVGAPILSSTTRGPLAFVMGNAPDANPAGAFIPASTSTILSASGYGMLSTVRETLRLYAGDYGLLVSKQWAKLETLYGAFEVPDNPSLYYAARVSPVARWGLPFLPVAALGLAGLLLVLPEAARSPRAALIPLFFLACNALFLLAHVVSRYRQPLAMALIILGSAGAVHCVEAWRDRSGSAARRFVFPVAAVFLLIVLPKGPPEGYGYVRPAEFVLSADLYARRGEVDRAIEEMEALIAAAPSEPLLQDRIPSLRYKLGLIQAEAGRHREAVETFRAVLRERPGHPGARKSLAESQAAIGGDGG